MGHLKILRTKKLASFPIFFLIQYLSSLFPALGVNGEPVVYLTVSSLASRSRTEPRLLELNWYGLPDQQSQIDAWIRLFSHEPYESDTEYLVSVDPNKYLGGHYKTSIQFPIYTFDSRNLTDSCLGFWISYVISGRINATSCMRARPHWMHESKEFLENKSLSELVIPGTHNAACYGQYVPEEDTLLKRYLITQEENIFNQLAYGIRYLDLRVAYERVVGSPERFWITHSVFSIGISVREVISQVKKFLNATNEIVILDFHRFVNGFNGRRARQKHRLLIQLLENELSDYMIPVSATLQAKLHDLWKMNRTLLVGYASNSERRRSSYLFPAVKHLWADKDRGNDLFWYLNETICGQENYKLVSAMAQLTPTTGGTLFDFYGGLRKMADEVNRYVSKWLRELWWECANIVATDFFLGSNVVETAIELNKKRSSS